MILYVSSGASGTAADPYWGDVILHINGNVSDTKDDSFVNASITSTASRTTTNQKYGAGGIDLSAGNLTVANDTVYASYLLANEWTFQWWQKVNSLPVNSNNRLFYFGGMTCALNASGSIVFSAKIGTDTVNVGTPDSQISVGSWQHVAVVRVNNGASSHLEIFVDGTYIASSSSFSESSLAGNFGSLYLVLGYDSGGTSAYVDDYQLTRNIKRYTANFTPPLELPTS